MQVHAARYTPRPFKERKLPSLIFIFGRGTEDGPQNGKFFPQKTDANLCRREECTVTYPLNELHIRRAGKMKRLLLLLEMSLCLRETAFLISFRRDKAPTKRGSDAQTGSIRSEVLFTHRINIADALFILLCQQAPGYSNTTVRIDLLRALHFGLFSFF